MQHHSNVYPTTSPLWCNVTPTCGNITPMYDGYHFWFWNPGRNYSIWFDTPLTELQLSDGNVCYRLQGNVWFCPTVPEAELPPEVIPMPSPVGNVKPMISVTSVKMENHPEHVSVMFGQILNNLK